MNASVVLWENWHPQVKQLLRGIHGHQKKTLAVCVLGLILSGSAILQRVAESLHLEGISQAKMPSIERRLARFVANRRIQVLPIGRTFLEQVLPQWHGQAVRLVLDMTPCGDHARIVYLGLLVHTRVLPLMWRVMPLHEEWDQGQWDLLGQMFDEVQPYLASCACTRLPDRGLRGAPLVKLCRHRQWHYLLRLAKEHTCRRLMGKGWADWRGCGQVVHKAGHQWFGRVLLWQEDTLGTSLSAVWDEEHREAWFLLSDLPAGRRRVHEYALRMRVESTFQDTKSRGWDLEASLIEDLERLNRLLLALFVAMWWVIHLAASCLHHGQGKDPLPPPHLQKSRKNLHPLLQALSLHRMQAREDERNQHHLRDDPQLQEGASYYACTLLERMLPALPVHSPLPVSPSFPGDQRLRADSPRSRVISP